MLYVDIFDNMKSFINTVGVVERRQLYTLFRKCTTEQVDGVIRQLKHSKYVVEKKDGLLERTTKCALTPAAQELITKAAWIPVQYGVDGLQEVLTAQFPSQLFFITSDWQCMDVTVIYPQTMNSQMSAAKRYFEHMTPNQMEDATIHIAMLYGKDMSHRDTVAKSGIFDYYAEIEDNEVKLFRCEETCVVMDLEEPITNGKNKDTSAY